MKGSGFAREFGASILSVLTELGNAEMPAKESVIDFTPKLGPHPRLSKPQEPYLSNPLHSEDKLGAQLQQEPQQEPLRTLS